MTFQNKLQFHTVYANTVDAYIPELWANEALMILEDRLLAANLCKRDFEDKVQKYGDTINTRLLSTFTAKRKIASDDVTDQNAIATNVQVVLDQHVHVSFVLKDAEISLSFKDLATEFLRPALIEEGKFLDQIVLGQAGNFLAKAVGGLGTMTKTNVSDYITDAFTKMNLQKVPEEDRSMIWTPTAYGLGLKNSLFVQANTSGDGGNAQRRGDLGTKFGFTNYFSTLASEVAAGNVTRVMGEINGGNITAGSTSLTVDGFSAAISNGSFISINGIPYRVVSTTGGATPTAITIASPGLLYDVADNDDVYSMTPGDVNNVAGYAAGWNKEILVDGFTTTKVPGVGQMIAFGTGAPVYTVIQSTYTGAGAATLLLDRSLELAIADGDKVAVTGIGTTSFGFHKEAIALVVRPLAQVPEGAGARCSVINYNGLSVRVTIAYDSKAQGLRITVDFLCGVKTLNPNLGVLMLG